MSLLEVHKSNLGINRIESTGFKRRYLIDLK